MAVPEILRYRNSIDYEVSGDYALFSDPITRASGEKCSYHLPTYSALVGITSSIYWKPTFMWVIDYVRIMNPIITEKRGVKIHDYNTNTVDLFYYMYLKDVRYQVRAHMIPNVNHPEFANDWNEVNFWNPVLQPGGIVKFIRPEECKSKKFIRNMPLTQFEIKNPDEITNLEKY